MSNDKDNNSDGKLNILNLVNKPKEKTKEKENTTKNAINKAMEKVLEEDLQDQPQPQQLYRVTLMMADPEKRHIKIIIDVTPTTIIMAKNKEAIFLFAQVQEFPDYTVYIYQEVSAILLDVQVPPEDTSHGAE